jgi:hypothetical protein
VSTPSDLTQTGEALVYGMVNAANPSLQNGALSSANTSLGAPMVTGATPNTSVEITATANQGYSGNVTVDYNRLAIDTQVFNIYAPDGATVVNTGGTMATINDVVAALNTTYGLNLQAEDVSNGSTALSLTNEAGTCTVDIAATSLVYTGSLNVAITQQQVALSTAITTTALSGLNAPTSPPA